MHINNCSDASAGWPCSDRDLAPVLCGAPAIEEVQPVPASAPTSPQPSVAYQPEFLRSYNDERTI
jgi:hypothetical protein